jgi:hypothetical protein
LWSKLAEVIPNFTIRLEEAGLSQGVQNWDDFCGKLE